MKFLILLSIIFFQGSIQLLANEIDTFSNYRQLLEKAISEVETDSSKALETIHGIDFFQCSSSDSNFIKLAIAKLDFLATHYSPNLLTKESNDLIRKCEEDNSKICKARIRSYLADYYLELNQLDSSFKNTEKAIQLYEELELIEKVGELLLTKSVIYYSQDEYIQSIKTVFEAVEKFKGIDENKQMAFAYLQIGSTYLYINYLDEAEKNYRLASTYFLKMQDSLGHAICNSNLGLIEYERKNYSAAISLLKRAQLEILKSNRQIMIAFAHQAIGECYIELNNIDSALYYTNQSYRINDELDYLFGRTKDYYLFAKIKNQLNQTDSALYYANESLKLLELEPDYELEYGLSILLANLYSKNNQTDLSNVFLRRHISVIDSMNNEKDFINQLSISENQNLKETEYALAIAKQKELLNLKKSELQANIIILLVVLLTGILAGSIFLFIANRSNKILNQQLTKELSKNNSLIQEIHHRVKNNLQVIASMLNIQSQYQDEPKVKDILAECRSRIDSMAIIHESLYKSENNLAPLFSNYIENLIPLLIDTYHIDSNKINLVMDLQSFNLSLDHSIPSGLIINEVITNSLKHAFPTDCKGEIYIKTSLINNKVQLLIKDNGIGLPKGFDPTKQETFGFFLINTLVEQLDAKIEINTENGLSLLIEWQTENQVSTD